VHIYVDHLLHSIHVRLLPVRMHGKFFATFRKFPAASQLSPIPNNLEGALAPRPTPFRWRVFVAEPLNAVRYPRGEQTDPHAAYRAIKHAESVRSRETRPHSPWPLKSGPSSARVIFLPLDGRSKRGATLLTRRLASIATSIRSSRRGVSRKCCAAGREFLVY